MTAPTPTAALTPEELAAELDRSAEILGHGTGALMRGAAHMIRAQKLHTDRVDNKLVEQAAEIERLTKERDELRARDLSWSKTFQRIEVEANEDVRKLATSLERERVMREALKPFGTGAVAQAVEDSDYSIMRERIVDWFGPSDFKAAREAYGAALQQQETADER